jgi:phage gp36-like protein
MYSTLADLITIEPAQQIMQLTDDSGAETIDTAIVNAQIAEADELIDAVLRGRVTMPSPVPKIIQQISAELAVCYLYRRRFGSNMPDTITSRIKSAERKLADIASGVIKISDIQSGEQARAKISVKANAQVFTNDLLSQY